MITQDSYGVFPQVSLPFSLSPPRADQDTKKDNCLTCDMGISENSFKQCKANPEFLRMIVDTATKNVSTNFLKNFEEVKNDFKVEEPPDDSRPPRHNVFYRLSLRNVDRPQHPQETTDK